MTEKNQMVCRNCGSASIAADSCSRWSVEAQDWETSCVYDKGHSCDVCGGECRIDEVPFDKWAATKDETQVLNSREVGTVFYDDENKWRGQVSDEDVGPVWSSRLLYDDQEDAKDAARRWAMTEEQD